MSIDKNLSDLCHVFSDMYIVICTYMFCSYILKYGLKFNSYYTFQIDKSKYSTFLHFTLKKATVLF